MHTISDYQKFVEEEIKQIKRPGHPVSLYEPVDYIMSLGGKRIRPVLTLLANELFGGDVQTAIKPALAMEMFHNFTLLHDDLMDNARLRRGQPTVHEKWNSSTAILSGDVMLVLAYDLFLEVDKNALPAVLHLFNETAKKVCEGQQLDMMFENEETVTLDAYIEMTGLKTAALLAGCLKMGALLANSAVADAENIYRFGYLAGIAFQLQDDLLDAFGESENVGKTIGGDIAANKKTFLTVKAFELAAGETKEELKYLFAQKHMDAGSKICEVLAIYDALGIKQEAEKARDSFFNKALEHLALVNTAENNKQSLKDLAQMLVSRDK
jgi:geranylgeranyl diphosphate synthase type II